MRFLLAFVLSFVSVFAVAQVAPPMILGGPQGINVTRALVTNWLSIPTYTDTLSASPGGAPWPGRGYIIQVVKTRDTSLWQYTGQRWSRIAGVSQETFTKLLTGGDVNQVGTSRQYTVSPSTYYINGVFYTLNNPTTVTSASKTANANGRIDVITLATSGVEIIQGTETPVPLRPSVGANRIELAAIYYRPFDTVPRDAGNGITSVYRILGKDSLYFTSRDTVFAIRDSIGVAPSDTAAMLNKYKFTAANGLTKDSTVFRLGGSLNQNTDINLNTRRLTIIGGVDTTRFFSNGRVSIGGTPDSTHLFTVKGTSNLSSIVTSNNLSINRKASTVGDYSMAISSTGVFGATASNTNTMAIGESSSATSVDAIAIGNYSLAGAPSSTAVGVRAKVNNFGSIAIGNLVEASGGGAIAIGIGSFLSGGPLTANARELVIGNGNYDSLNATQNPINTVIIGSNRLGNPGFSGNSLSIMPSPSNGANLSAGNITIAGGRGTGNATPGAVIFATSSDTTSGTALQTLKERARITPTGNLLVGKTSQSVADTIYKVDVNGAIIARGEKGVSYWVPGGTAIRGATIGGQIYIDGDSTLGGTINYRANTHTFGGQTNAQQITCNGLKATGNNTIIEAEATGIGIPSIRITDKDTSTWYFENSRNVSKMLEITNDISGATQPAISIADSRVVCIGTRTVDTSSVLNVTSTSKGFLQPRLTNTQRDAITTPATGLQLFSTTDSANYVYRGTGGGWQKIANEITKDTTIDFPSTGHGTSYDVSFTVTGAELGDVVSIGIPHAAMSANISYTAWVSAANQVTIRLDHYASSGNVDPASGTFKVKVFK